MKRRLIAALALCCCLLTPLATAAPVEPLDGRNHIFKDDLLDNLVGKWVLTREMRGKSVESAADAAWVLNHQYLHISLKDATTPQSYEAEVFIGYDNTSERYVAHWIDVFGGRVCETLGYGHRSGNSIALTFEYPDGPFHNTLVWDPSDKHWQFRMEGKSPSGTWNPFATDTLRRAP